MLIHKRTMGILDQVWFGQYRKTAAGRILPAEHPCTLADVEDPENWWEVPSRGALARQAKLHYPDIVPVTDEEGNLIGVKPIETEASIMDQEMKKACQEIAKSRGYQDIGRIRPRRLMPFIKP